MTAAQAMTTLDDLTLVGHRLDYGVQVMMHAESTRDFRWRPGDVLVIQAVWERGILATTPTGWTEAVHQDDVPYLEGRASGSVWWRTLPPEWSWPMVFFVKPTWVYYQMFHALPDDSRSGFSPSSAAPTG